MYQSNFQTLQCSAEPHFHVMLNDLIIIIYIWGPCSVKSLGINWGGSRILRWEFTPEGNIARTNVFVLIKNHIELFLGSKGVCTYTQWHSPRSITGQGTHALIHTCYNTLLYSDATIQNILVQIWIGKSLIIWILINQ